MLIEATGDTLPEKVFSIVTLLATVGIFSYNISNIGKNNK